MPTCKNCEAFVTEQYVRVLAPNGMDTVRVCPNCEDKLRDGAEVRQALSERLRRAHKQLVGTQLAINDG